MSLWNEVNRTLVIVATISVLAACYAVAAWGQDGVNSPAGRGLFVGKTAWANPTVTVASLRIPPAAWRHYERAKIAADRHRDVEFERESAEALAIAPDFASMYILRATVEVGAHQYDAAVASAQAAIEADPGTMWATVVLAGAYNGMHRFHDAIQVLDAKHGIEAETWQAAYEHARAATGLGDAVAALHWSGLALQSAPVEFADTHLVRMNALILADRWTDAAAQIDLYLQSAGPHAQRAAVLGLRDAIMARIAATAKIEDRKHSQMQRGLQMASR